MNLLAFILVGSTYVPSLSVVTNLEDTLQTNYCQYLQVDSVVTVSCQIDEVQAVLNASLTKFKISVPVSSSFTNDTQCVGVGVSASGTTPFYASIASEVDGTCSVRWYSTSTQLQRISLHFTYLIK